MRNSAAAEVFNEEVCNLIERREALGSLAENLSRTFYGYGPDFFLQNVARIVEDAVSVFRGALDLWPTPWRSATSTRRGTRCRWRASRTGTRRPTRAGPRSVGPDPTAPAARACISITDAHTGTSIASLSLSLPDGSGRNG